MMLFFADVGAGRHSGDGWRLLELRGCKQLKREIKVPGSEGCRVREVAKK